MAEPDYIETARLMARFQQEVRRSLHMLVDLGAMARDPGYAHRILADVERRTRDTELRATVDALRVRLPKPLPGSVGAGEGAGHGRFTRFGGRSE